MAKMIQVSFHRTCLIFSLLSATVGCDQVSKIVVRDTLPITGPLSYFDDFVRFQYAANPGAFLSLGAGLSQDVRFWIFNVAVGVFLLGLALILFRGTQTRPVVIVGLALILGGGIGNLIDRLLFGAVTDFLILGTGALKTGIFNFADAMIVLGVVLLALPKQVSRI